MMVQPKTSGPGYEVFGVGKEVTFQGNDCVLPDGVVPVFVAAVEKTLCKCSFSGVCNIVAKDSLSNS